MSRVNFKTILDRYKAVGKSNVRLTQSSLFLTKPIDATKSAYQFDVLETQTSTLLADEIRLNLNDDFIITHMGLYLQAELSAPSEAIPAGVHQLFTYAPRETNGVAGGKLQNVYGGQLQISVNNIVFLDKWDTRKHEFIPRTQMSSNNGLGTSFATLPSNDFSKNAMYPIEPLLTLSGAKKNDIRLSLPTAITAGIFTYTDDAGVLITATISRIGLLLRGLNAQNASSFQK